jgi:hypothetical protein
MKPEQLRERLYNKPFTPFRVRLKDGRHFDILHPRLNLVGESVFIIGIPAPDDPNPGYSDHTEWVRLSLIDSLESLPESTAPAASCQSRQQLIDHLYRLLDDFDAAGNQWENQDIDAFLKAMAAWLNDCEGYYRNTGQLVDVNTASWQIFADALSAATVYE